MKQLVLNWLSGNREFFTGILILKMIKILPDDQVKKISILNDANKKELLNKLESYVTDISKSSTSSKQELSIGARADGINGDVQEQQRKEYSETNLYKSAKKKADDAYKELMNIRAVLFSDVKSALPHEDLNTPDKIEKRKKAAIQVAMDYQKVSKLYEIADYVKLYGKLPFDGVQDEIDLASIPDHLVKNHIDNIRKNLSKLKKKEQTPERIQLIDYHTANLNLLLNRWQLLKPQD